MDNPIPTVGVLIFKDDKVLLVRHKKEAEHISDTFGLPAGRVQEGETEKGAARRELEEEAGLEVLEKDLIELPTVYIGPVERKNGVYIFSYKIFLSSSYSGALRESEESKPEWVAVSELDKYNLLPNVGKIIEEGLLVQNKAAK